MLHKLNNFLEKSTGLRLIHVQRRKPIPDTEHPGTNNLIVEFIGASCVGKTTLCNHFIKNYTSKQEKKVMDKIELASFDTSTIELKNAQANILKEKICFFGEKKGMEASARIRKLNKLYIFLKEDYLIANYLSDSLLVLDEHLLSRFYNELPKEDKDLEELLKNRLFIHCTLSSKAHIKRIEERRKGRIKPKLYRDYKDQALEKASRKQLGKKKELAALLAQKGARILEVDVADGLEKNSTLIANFIDDYLNQKVDCL